MRGVCCAAACLRSSAGGGAEQGPCCRARAGRLMVLYCWGWVSVGAACGVCCAAACLCCCAGSGAGQGACGRAREGRLRDRLRDIFAAAVQALLAVGCDAMPQPAHRLQQHALLWCGIGAFALNLSLGVARRLWCLYCRATALLRACSCMFVGNANTRELQHFVSASLMCIWWSRKFANFGTGLYSVGLYSLQASCTRTVIRHQCLRHLPYAQMLGHLLRSGSLSSSRSSASMRLCSTKRYSKWAAKPAW